MTLLSSSLFPPPRNFLPQTALVGVSLCDADASVAAPLTSKNQSISCVVDVVAEGRCSLVTAYNIFQFVMVYAFVQVWGGGGMGERADPYFSFRCAFGFSFSLPL